MIIQSYQIEVYARPNLNSRVGIDTSQLAVVLIRQIAKVRILVYAERHLALFVQAIVLRNANAVLHVRLHVFLLVIGIAEVPVLLIK